METAILLRVINTSAGIIGILGNILVCLVIIGERSMHTKTNVLILHQATIDFLASILILLYEYIPQVNIVTKNSHGYIVCYLWNSRYFLLTFFVASTYSLIAVTFERFFAIVYPYRYQRYFAGKKGVGLIIGGAWIIVFSFRVYAFLQWSVNDEGICESSPSGAVLAVAVFLLQYVVPLSSMTYMYIRIGIDISRSARRVLPTVSETDPEHSTGERAKPLLRARRNTIKTLLTVFVIFVLCWSLNQVIFFMHNMGWRPINFTSAVYITSTALIASNASVNPFIYAFKYKKFQQSLRRVLYRAVGRLHRLNLPEEMAVTSQSNRLQMA